MTALSPETIAVAVSGGVDSLYALAVLQEQAKERGGSVLALHARLLPPELASDGYEAMLERLADSCARLGVPLHVRDCVERFTNDVITPFVRDYASGVTPNPCAHCNARIKFGLLLTLARELGATTLATGHYAHLEQTQNGPALYAGADSAKDQSYFLSLVPASQMAHTVFPLAALSKDEIRAWLATRGMEIPAPTESQDVCFVPGDDYRAFIQSYAASVGITLPPPGRAVLPDGVAVGTHKGLWQYTEGQRRGLGIAWREPLYVLAKNMDTNTLTVGPASALAGETVTLASCNWLVPLETLPETVLIRTRYRQKAREASITAHDGQTVTLHEHVPGGPYAKGQLATIYLPEERDGATRLRVLGGGVIA